MSPGPVPAEPDGPEVPVALPVLLGSDEPEPDGVADDAVTRTRTPDEDREVLPAASRCTAERIRDPGAIVVPDDEHAQPPSVSTVAMQTGERPTETVTTARGSPVPETRSGCARTLSAARGSRMRGAAGALRSRVIVRGDDAALRRSDR